MEKPREVLGPVTEEDLDAVASFYESVGYGVGVVPGDRIMAVREGKNFLAAVRLTREENTLVLRGMYVAPDRRGQGIGSRLLDAVVSTMGPQESWCVPYAHLREFYSQVGFEEYPLEMAPGFLEERARRYLKSGHRIIVMKRGKNGPERI